MEAVMDKQKVEQYSVYRESEIDWIGKIPKHWELKPIRAIFEERNEKNIGPKTDYILSVTRDRGVIPYDEKGNIGNNKSDDIERYKVVYPNDLVINKMNVIIGSLGLSKYHGALSQVYIVLRPRTEEFSISYYSYLFSNESFYKSLIRYCTGIMELRESLSKEEFKKLWLPLPPIKEQTAIATFLKSKTAQINTAIAQKEKLIELLIERRQVLIHNAVTRGLGPHVKMKNSGVEWVGEIPEHWEVKKLKFIVSVLKRIANAEGFDVLSITQKGIKVKDIESGEGQLAMDYSKYQLIFKGEFAMNHMDLLTGYIDLSKFDGVISPDYRVFDLKSNSCTKEYLLYLFQMCYKARIFYQYGQGVSQLGRWRFPAENFNNFKMPIPPIDEQRAISSFVEKVNVKIEKALLQKRNEIENLKEYKATLINAAVTGKIKVN